MKLFSLKLSSALAFVLCVSSFSPAFASPAFPLSPGPMTPGELCQNGNARRYPERITYCERAVTSEQKYAIIDMYDRTYGFRIGQMPRSQFKIDHYIPLCAGGSNSPRNLWPQHQSVYAITDPLEPLICEKMAAGRLKQKDAVAIVIQAKNDLKQVPTILRKLQAL